MLDNPFEKETLPVEANSFIACSSYMVLQTIAYLDEAIEAEEDRLAYYRQQRELLVNRALKESIGKTGEYELVTTPVGSLRRNPITNITDFKEKFREAYHMIRDQQKRDLADAHLRKLNAIEESEIPLTLADKKAGKDLITDYVGYQPQAMKIEVRKIGKLLG